MSHPYRKSYLKRREVCELAEEPQMLPSAPRFTLSICANTATLNLSDHKIDRVYRHQLKNALTAALNKGVNVFNLDLSACDGLDFGIVSTFLTLGKGVKIDVLPHSH